MGTCIGEKEHDWVFRARYATWCAHALRVLLPIISTSWCLQNSTVKERNAVLWLTLKHTVCWWCMCASEVLTRGADFVTGWRPTLSDYCLVLIVIKVPKSGYICKTLKSFSKLKICVSFDVCVCDVWLPFHQAVVNNWFFSRCVSPEMLPSAARHLMICIVPLGATHPPPSCIR